jgi:hypothetical protein
VALACAIGLSVLAWRLLRTDRQRSISRVETLAALAAADQGPDERDDHAPVRDWREHFTESPAGSAWLFETPIEPRTVGHPDVMFRATDERGAPGRRWVALAAVGAAMALGIVGAYLTLATPHARAAAPATAAPASAPSPHPLELLTLQHEFGPDGTFTITGLVQNPFESATRHHVLAVAYLFDADGHYFAGGRAPIASADLHPGDPSSFVIRVAGVSRVARYRVGFRTDDGVVVAHVDKRGQSMSGTTSHAAGAPHAAGTR